MGENMVEKNISKAKGDWDHSHHLSFLVIYCVITQWISHCHRPWSLSVAIYISSGRCRKQLKNYNKAGIQQFCIGPLYHHSISCRDSVDKVQRHASGWAMQDYKLTSSINCHAWRAELNIAAVKKEESRLSMLYRFRDYLLSIDSKHSPASGNQRKSCCPTNTYSIDMPFCWTLYQQQTSHHILVEHSQTASLKLLPTVLPLLIMFYLFTSLWFACNIQSRVLGG